MILISALTEIPLSVPITHALQNHPMVQEASRLADAYRSGGARALKEAYDGCEKPLTSDQFVKEITDVIKLNAM